MNIIVCLKQVPGTSKVALDEKTGTLIRSGVVSKMNPYDLYALETALRMKEKHEGVISVITMGPIQAEEIIREAFAMGADNGFLISDVAFAGADVLATARALSLGIKKLGGFDMIICGKQTTDGDTAQVGPETAEFLGIPHVSNVTDIKEAYENSVIVEADMGDSVQVLEIPYPCLIAVEKDIYTPRLPSYKKKINCAGKEIKVLTIDDLEVASPEVFGLEGSPTQVERVFPPEMREEKIAVNGTGAELAEFLYGKLKETKFLNP